jgi:hypothetical protein
MLSTFDVLDSALPDLKPDWMIREEIANKAVKIRTDVLSKCSVWEVTAYNSGVSENELQKQNEVADKMRNALKEACEYDYVTNSKILSPRALNILMVDYLEAF